MNTHRLAMRCLLPLCAIFLFSLSSLAQDLEVVVPAAVTDADAPDGYHKLMVADLPQLTGISADPRVFPHYRHLFLPGDGTFRLVSEDSILFHRYPNSSPSPPSFTARNYSSGIYTGTGPPPPQRARNIPGHTGTDTSIHRPMRLVPNGVNLNLSRDVDATPDGRMVHIISIKNQSQQDIKGGHLLLFYGGEITARSVVQTGTGIVVNGGSLGTALGFGADLPTGLRASFNHDESLLYFPALGRGYFDINNLAAALGAGFDHVLIYPFTNLLGNDEIRLFAQLKAGSSLLNGLDPKKNNTTDVVAVLLVDEDATNLPNQAAANALLGNYFTNFGNVLTQLQAPNPATRRYTYTQATDSTQVSEFGDNISLATTVADAQYARIPLRASQDPNFMLAEACPCPEEEAMQQVLVRVHSDNEGLGSTHDVYIDIELPTGLDADLVDPEFVSFYPAAASSQVKLIKLDDRHIRWHLQGLILQSTQLYGSGHEYTYTDLVFSMYTRSPIASIGELQACIRFDDATADPVCTVPVSIAAHDGSTMDCRKCNSDIIGTTTPPPGGTWWEMLPWWGWLLLLLLVLLIILLLARRSTS